MSFRNLSLIVLFTSFGATLFAQTSSPTSNTNMPQPAAMAILAASGIPSDDDIDESIVILQMTLDLTPDQIKDIRQLAQNHRDRLKSISAKADPKFAEFSALLDQSDSDPAAIGRAAQELKSIREQVTREQAEVEQQLLTVLTPKQRETVNDLGRATAVFVSLRQIGLLQPDLAHGIFMNGLQAPVTSKTPSSY